MLFYCALFSVHIYLFKGHHDEIHSPAKHHLNHFYYNKFYFPCGTEIQREIQKINMVRELRYKENPLVSSWGHRLFSALFFTKF